MNIDRSQGWDSIAGEFMAARSTIGAGFVRSWARDNLAAASAVVDVGCGSGVPIAQGLMEDGFQVFGIDASPALAAAFHRRFPLVPLACEPAQDSVFFHRTFDAAIAVGLLFLLSPKDQRLTMQRVATALDPGGRFLFSAPREACEWPDLLTGRRSVSLGHHGYEGLLATAGFQLLGCHGDEGGNNYYDARLMRSTVGVNR